MTKDELQAIADILRKYVKEMFDLESRDIKAHVAHEVREQFNYAETIALEQLLRERLDNYLTVTVTLKGV